MSSSLLPRAAVHRVKTKESSDTLFTREEYHCFYSFLQLQRSKRCRVDRPDGRPQRQYRRRRNRQLIDAHRQESLGQLRIRAQLAADADPDSRPVRVLRRHAEHAQHRRMVRVEKPVETHALPVDSQRILRQIVRADREKVHLTRQLCAHHDGGRCLDHNAELDLVRHRHALFR